MDKIKEIEAKIVDLKARWPPHSVPPRMWQELEKLEDELEKVKSTTDNKVYNPLLTDKFKK